MAHRALLRLTGRLLADCGSLSEPIGAREAETGRWLSVLLA
jgi:hypothetical protein